MICPITTEQITKDHKNTDELILQWQTVFCIASGIHFFGVIFYALFASGELQDWAQADPKEETMEMNNDFEKPNNGYATGANPNVVTGGQEQQSFLQGETAMDYSEGGSAQPSANPFTSGQNNPFRQWGLKRINTTMESMETVELGVNGTTIECYFYRNVRQLSLFSFNIINGKL